ncbi:hypothetical protein D3C72_1580610 [compost metagenome]
MGLTLRTKAVAPWAIAVVPPASPRLAKSWPSSPLSRSRSPLVFAVATSTWFLRNEPAIATTPSVPAQVAAIPAAGKIAREAPPVNSAAPYAAPIVRSAATPVSEAPTITP